jgi:outer membrane protein OmpA-like peptidoglycan-associated protein
MILATLGAVTAQQPASAPQQNNAPIYHLTMVGGTITAVNYQHRSGSTMIDFQGTPLLHRASGKAKVDSKQGSLVITADFKDLEPAQKFGAEYLTYVLWAITPEGKPSNLGEVVLNGTKSKLNASTPLQSFGLMVSAEPYFAVSQPSNVVVLENIVRADTAGTIDQVKANFELLERGQYVYDVSRKSQGFPSLDPKVPLEVYEARNAVQIAQAAGAEKYAADAYSKAQTSLSNAENLLASKGDKKQMIAAARDAVQTAADARQITLKRKEEERLAQEQAAAAAREAQAKAEAEAAAAKQKQEEEARRAAEIQKLQAERDAAREAQARAEADAARVQADAARAAAQQQEQAALQKQKAAEEAAAKAEAEKQQLRASLLQQFNRVLPTTDTPRGLKVNMADVLFATAKYDLQPPAREALAKLSGIVLAHPGLKLQVEGHTDNTGTDAFNQTLSEKRAYAVRDYLVQQGLDPASITSMGFGSSIPAASNDTPQGRQMNRRVEIIISGEVIGTQIGSNPAAQTR